ncbi:probable RNA-binding protein 18 [Acanthaster planci]|uniref:Probable RNA-binding protein 18 n=1 Tax=Acanthaster planci TaxID=133434 RepID=A0A8B7Z411_ACAPL|nr:probable RNA-binding protein 18 [Acanthaster planci]
MAATVSPFDKTERRRLWIGNIDEKISEFNLLKLLRRYGEIAQFDFLFHKTGPSEGKPRGYCFVSFKTQEEAELAIHGLDGKLALNKRLAVKWAHSQTPNFKTQEPIEDEKTSLAPDKLPSSFGGHQSTTPGSSMKKQVVINSNDAKIRAIENKLRQMENASADFNVVPTFPGLARGKSSRQGHSDKRFKPYKKR